MYKSLRGIAAIALLSCAAATAMASAPVVATETYSFFDYGIDADKGTASAGTFVTNGDGDITSISGVFGDSYGTFGLIDGLVPLNTDGGYYYDNKYTGDFDYDGLLFDVGGTHVNLYKDDGSYYIWTTANAFNGMKVDLEITRVSETFLSEVSAVPESTSAAMMLAGLVGLMGLSLRRKARTMDSTSRA